MNIERIDNNKERFLDLLLLGDEQESMIFRYLEQGELFALYDKGLKSVCVVIRIDDTTVELKNIATYPRYQRLGYGKKLMSFLFELYEHKYKFLLVGTGDNARIISFYKKRGFEESHRVSNFFIDNYDHQIFEDGVQLVDMVYLKKRL